MTNPERTPWAGSNRRSELPADWSSRKRAVHERDGWRCVITSCRLPTDRIECDHIGDPHDHSLANLQTLCHSHHAKKTAHDRTAKRPSRMRAPEPHPGLRGGG